MNNTIELLFENYQSKIDIYQRKIEFLINTDLYEEPIKIRKIDKALKKLSITQLNYHNLINLLPKDSENE